MKWTRMMTERSEAFAGMAPARRERLYANLVVPDAEAGRMARHSETAAAVADLLASHRAVAQVLYPGRPDHPGYAVAARQMSAFGGMVSLRLAAGPGAALELCRRTELFTLAESLGAVESLIEHPARMTHASVADTANEALLLVGRKGAELRPDTLHPFGYARNRYFYSFVVALVLFTMGSLFAIDEAVHKILHPEELSSPLVAIVILLVSMILEGLSFATARRESAPLKGRHTWWHFIRHTRNPELPVGELAAAHVRQAAAANSAAGQGDWQQRATQELIALLRDDYAMLMQVMGALADVMQ